MNKLAIVPSVLSLFVLFNISCIDRETIAGTGKEIPYRIINVGGTLQFGQVTTKLVDPLVVRVVAANGRPVKGVFVVFYVEDQNASLSDSNKTTDADGYAQTYVTLGKKADSIYVYASVLGLKGSPVKFSLFATSSSTIDPKPTNPTINIFKGNNQTGNVGSKLPEALTVKVIDAYENPVPQMMIHFFTGYGSVNPDSALTDTQGFASSFWTLDTTIGTQNAQAVCHEALDGTVKFIATGTAILVPKYFTRLCGDTFISLQGLTINNILHVKVLDQYKNPVYKSDHDPFYVHFFVTEGYGSVDLAVTDTNGEAFSGVTLAPNDSILKITADVGYGVPVLNFTFFAYKFSQIDSLKSVGGIVTLYWQKNLNLNFANYTLQRCNNFNFDNTTIDVKIITDVNTVSTDDNTAVIGSSPFYRIRMNYTNGFYFYTNLRDVKVNP